MKALSLFLLIVLPIASFSQYYQDHKIEDTTLISPWIVANITEYEGVYFYGISEYETTSFLAIQDELIDFQISNAGKEINNTNGDFEGWESNTENYTNVKIIGNKFYSDQTNGEFVRYSIGGKENKCLRLDTPPKNVYKGESELGTFSPNSTTTYLHGKYSHLKFTILDLDELRKNNLSELKIMRNEIFVRYGYKFKVGGQMHTYFSKQKWYSAEKEDVTGHLTKIEKKNIENILKIEKELES